MEKRIMFKNCDHSTVIEDFANKCLVKVEKLLESERMPISINLVIEGHPNHAHNKVELLVNTAELHVIAHHEGPDIYQQVNTVVDKVIEEIRSAKEKRITERKNIDKYKGA